MTKMNVRIPISIKLVPCSNCGLIGEVYWNPFNKVIQCHNCGQSVEYVGFTLLIEGIALFSDKFGEELGKLNEALGKFIQEYPTGASLIPSNATFTKIENPFEEEKSEGLTNGS